MPASLLRIPRGTRLLAVFAVAVAAPCSVLAGSGAAASPRVAVPPAGTISTLAGTVGGPGPARSVAVAPCGRESRYRLCGLAFAGGHLYATDAGADNDGGLAVGCVVRSISISGGQLRTPAGDGIPGYSGDGGPASAAGLGCPADVAVDAAGNVVIADDVIMANQGDFGALRVRVVAAATGTFYGVRMTAGDIYTVAGDGKFGPDPVNGQPALHSAVEPGQVAVDHSGNLIIGMFEGTIWVVAVRDGTFYGQAMTAGDIYQIAGGGFAGRDGVPALKAFLGEVYVGAIQVDRHGNLVVAVSATGQIRVIATTTGRFYGQHMRAGRIYTVAGGGEGGGPDHLGDGGPAAQAIVSGPTGVAIDAHGNLVIADTGDDRIRVAAVTTGRFYGRHMTAGDIYTVAGGGTGQADGGTAGKAFLDHPRAVAIDSAGNIAVADAFARRLLLVAERAGTFYGVRTRAGHVYAIAGTGQTWLSGSGGPAAAAQLLPNSEAIGRGGNLLVADADYDTGRSEIRLVAATTGTFFGQHMTTGNLYTIAGIGRDGYSGNGGPAVLARLRMSTQNSGGDGGAIAASRTGNLVILDSGNNRVRVVADRSGRFYGIAMKAGHIYTVAGNGSDSDSGNGGLAIKAGLSSDFDDTLGIAVDASGNIAISDSFDNIIRMIAAVSGTFYGVPMKAGHIYRIAGNPKKTGFAGDGGPALAAEFNEPLGLAMDHAGNLLVDDSGNISFPDDRGRDRIRVVAATTGTFYGQHMTAGDVYTVAGGGKGLNSGDGGPATGAGLDTATVSVDPHGNLLLAGKPSSNLLEHGPSRVRIVAVVSGTFYGVPMTAGNIYTVAGTGKQGYAGDGGPATAAELSPADAVASTAGIYIADAANGRVRFVRS